MVAFIRRAHPMRCWGVIARKMAAWWACAARSCSDSAVAAIGEREGCRAGACRRAYSCDEETEREMAMGKPTRQWLRSEGMSLFRRGRSGVTRHRCFRPERRLHQFAKGFYVRQLEAAFALEEHEILVAE